MAWGDCIYNRCAMAKIFPGRFTAAIDGPFVVFMIGMRINRLWAFRKWMPVARAMPEMLAVLAKNPVKGMLGVQHLGTLA